MKRAQHVGWGRGLAGRAGGASVLRCSSAAPLASLLSRVSSRTVTSTCAKTQQHHLACGVGLTRTAALRLPLPLHSWRSGGSASSSLSLFRLAPASTITSSSAGLRACRPARRAYTTGGPSSSGPSSGGASGTGGTGGGRRTGAGGSKKEDWQQKNKNVGFILTTLILGGIALSYASVPLYQRFCQITGYGGTTRRLDLEEAKKKDSPDRWRKRTDRPLTVKFYSNTNSNIPWVFYPLQSEVRLVPGESTLAFYRAENPSPEDIVGIASYNVVPAKAGIYFQKIQCFCFEEQLLPAKKGVDMPVYFVIDPDFADDPNMHDVEAISLFYTFFRAKDFDELNAKAYDEAQVQQQQQKAVEVQQA